MYVYDIIFLTKKYNMKHQNYLTLNYSLFFKR